ncbi:PadR family transcriptional regulator [Rhodobacter sp. NTK016B]|uniref:PadR family transcriptional regulator n=1 Tax=Rhodobacter sp. NTK016B TaxID=2759676 RepID=UPI001A8DDE8B|nr:PadR family transcriptional regulator [Rhodobacter sp. NTK016B]MBN8294022.1 PadR family transcriptional regulator [Rhodobacter sp. NTK016B]
MKAPTDSSDACPVSRRKTRRLFDYGELRLLILSMIAERPRHGYQIIKAIEDRFHRSYSPSPGVVYPALSWLEEQGFVAVSAGEGGRKLSTITPQGRAALAANAALIADLKTRKPLGRHGLPVEVEDAMDAIKAALRKEFSASPTPERITAIAAKLHAAAESLNDVS